VIFKFTEVYADQMFEYKWSCFSIQSSDFTVYCVLN